MCSIAQAAASVARMANAFRARAIVVPASTVEIAWEVWGIKNSRFLNPRNSPKVNSSFLIFWSLGEIVLSVFYLLAHSESNAGFHLRVTPTRSLSSARVFDDERRATAMARGTDGERHWIRDSLQHNGLATARERQWRGVARNRVAGARNPAAERRRKVPVFPAPSGFN